MTAQWEVVEAFLAAARRADFDALVAVLDPDVLRADGGPTGLSRHVQGAESVARQALLWSRVDLTMRRALINGAAGMVTFLTGSRSRSPPSRSRTGRSSKSTSSRNPERIARLDLPVLDG